MMKISGAVLGSLLLAGSAHGGPLASGVLFGDATQKVGCVITNLGKNPATVQAQLLGFNGDNKATSNTCDQPILPGGSCNLFTDLSPGYAYCRVDGSGKLRGVLGVFSGNHEVFAVTLTK